MANKPVSARKPPHDAPQVFRQFAWNLAGTLATGRAKTAKGQTSRTAKRPGSR